MRMIRGIEVNFFRKGFLMKFSPFIVTAFAIFSLGLTGCQKKTAKDAAAEGNRAVAEAGAINQDLHDHYDVTCYSAKLTDADIKSKAEKKDWSKVDRTAVREKLNALIAKIDHVFKIDRRKDVKINDRDGSLQRARNNAVEYLRSLDNYEKSERKGMGGGGTLPPQL
jgi:hypothetical protein